MSKKRTSNLGGCYTPFLYFNGLPMPDDQIEIEIKLRPTGEGFFSLQGRNHNQPRQFAFSGLAWALHDARSVLSR